jgi:TfoX/Sxy family transcriptional regulator of competence genes
MACDERLVKRIREVLRETRGTGERRMFGGVCFTLNGHMFCGVVKEDIMLRVGPTNYAAALRRPHAREMDFTGKAMAGYVFVAKAGAHNEKSLRAWIDMAAGFVGALPVNVPKQESA